jgi:cation:H+ antiporter
MSIVAALVVFILGLVIVLFCAEQLVKGVVATSLTLGVSAFLIAVVFIGFDPDNLSVGVTASFEHAPGIAWGAIIGAGMVAVALAFGISAVFAPMTFEGVSKRLLVTPLLAILFLGALGMDGQLSRWDGAALLVGYAGSVLWIFHLSRRELDIRPAGELAESLEKTQNYSGPA